MGQLGAEVGQEDGCDAPTVGLQVGDDGATVGNTVGTLVGVTVGEIGECVGNREGIMEGAFKGFREGINDGFEVNFTMRVILVYTINPVFELVMPLKLPPISTSSMPLPFTSPSKPIVTPAPTMQIP